MFYAHLNAKYIFNVCHRCLFDAVLFLGFGTLSYLYNDRVFVKIKNEYCGKFLEIKGSSRAMLTIFLCYRCGKETHGAQPICFQWFIQGNPSLSYPINVKLLVHKFKLLTLLYVNFKNCMVAIT